MQGEIEVASKGEMIDVRTGALRCLSAEYAADTRAALPAKLTGFLAERPDATVRMSMIVDADGMVDARVAVIGDDVGEFAQALVAMMDVVGETECTPPFVTESCTLVRWPIIPADARIRLGFTIDGGGAVSAAWEPTSVLDAAALAAELSVLIKTGIQVEVRSVADDPSRLQARLAVLTDGPPPPIQLRASIRRHFPKLVVGADVEQANAWLTIRTAELAGVVAIPVGGPRPVPGFFTASAAPIPISPSRHRPTGTAIRIGQAVNAVGRKLPVELAEHERVRHMQILGRTGTGKSSTIAGMVHELAAANEGVLVLDPHGTLIDRIVAEIPAQAVPRLRVIRCGDVANPAPLSPLAEKDPVRRDIAIDDTCAIFQELFDKKETGIVGPRFRERVAMGMRALCALYGDTASILDVPVILGDDTMMSKAVAESGNDRLASWYANDKVARRSPEYGELVSWVNSKFEAFASTAALRAILGSGKDAIDFADAMDNRHVILVDLSKAELGESATRLLGYLYLNRVWAGGLRRHRRDVPFTVVVDEAQSLISGSLSVMLSEGRKFGLSVVLSHQYLTQLDENLRPAVDGNVATTIAFRSAVSDTLPLKVRFGGLVDTSTLTTLPDLSAVVMRSSSQVAVPHTLVIDHNDRVQPRDIHEAAELGEYVAERTREALVDPYREATSAALQGTSRVTETRKHLRQQPTEPDAKPESNFLDEWLAKRRQVAGTKPGTDVAPSDEEATS